MGHDVGAATDANPVATTRSVGSELTITCTGQRCGGRLPFAVVVRSTVE